LSIKAGSAKMHDAQGNEVGVITLRQTPNGAGGDDAKSCRR
jgi:hypothetical protein